MKWKNNGKENPLFKLDKLYNAALDMFSENSFNEASLNKILKNAHINKGSFYNKFDDKMDLYLSILDIHARKKEKIAEKLIVQDLKIKTLLSMQIKVNMQLSREDPRILNLTSKIIFESKEVKEAMYKEYGQLTENGFQMLVQKAMENGEINDKLDTRTVAMYMQRVLSDAYYYIDMSQDEETVNKQYEQVLDIIFNGISNDSIKQ